jgi:hypothetical protein
VRALRADPKSLYEVIWTLVVISMPVRAIVNKQWRTGVWL